MIKDVLRSIAQEKSWPEIASELGCSAQVLEAMLGQLEQGGYLIRQGEEEGVHSSECAPTACQTCLYKKMCAANKSKMNIWSLTEKGRQAAEMAD